MTIKEPQLYRGKWHHLVELAERFPAPVTVFIDPETGLISKMERPTRDKKGAITYVFGSYRKQSGVAYATDLTVYTRDVVTTYLKSRKVEINADVSDAFIVGSHIKQEPKRVDNSGLTVNEVGKNTHLVGQGRAYSMFVDVGEFIIGVGGYGYSENFARNYKAYQEALGHEKPLKYFIVTPITLTICNITSRQLKWERALL